MISDTSTRTPIAEFVEAVAKAYGRIHAAQDPSYAYELARLVETYLVKNPPVTGEDVDDVAKLKKLHIDCKWIALAMVRPAEAEELFSTNFKSAWELMPEYDLWGAMKGLLLTIVNLDERDALKKRIRELLEKNQIVLTTKLFMIGGTRPAGGTLANWIADYQKFIGAGELSPFVFTTYLSGGSNMMRLDERDRDRAKQVFQLYARLDRSSRTPEGLEEDIPFDTPYGMGVVRDGEFIKYEESALRDPAFWQVQKIFAPGSNEAPLPLPPSQIAVERATAAYQGVIGLREAIGKEEMKWNEFLSANPSREAVFERIYNTLAPAMGAPSVQAVMGALLAAGKAKGLLRDFLKEDRRAIELLKAWLGKEGEAQMRDFLLSPASPLSLALFLRTLLERRLGLNPSESARLGLHVANALKRGGFPEYMTMARYNAGLGSFEWSV